MFKFFLEHVNLAWLPGVGLILFLGIFLGVLYWVLKSDRTQFYQQLAKLPFSQQEDADEF